MSPTITNIHGRWSDKNSDKAISLGDFAKQEWQSVSIGLLLLFSLASFNPSYHSLEAVSLYIGYGYFAVIALFLISYLVHISWKLVEVGFFAEMRRFGATFLGIDSIDAQKPIYLGQDTFVGVTGLPNYYAGSNLSVLRDFYENNKHNRSIRIFVLHSEGNESHYERCPEQDIPPVSLSSHSIGKIMHAIQRLSVEPDKKRPEIIILVEDIMSLAGYSDEVQAIIDGYSNGMRIIYCGIQLTDPNAHRIQEDEQGRLISTPITDF